MDSLAGPFEEERSVSVILAAGFPGLMGGKAMLASSRRSPFATSFLLAA